jgi:hypothetical protein
MRDKHLSAGIIADFGDNVDNEFAAFAAQYWRRKRELFDWT